MLFRVYLVTTIFSYAVFGVAASAVSKRLKREGYRLNDDNKTKSLPEKVISFLRTLIPLSIPVYNYYTAIKTIGLITEFGEGKLYEDFLKRSLEKGKICKIDEKQPSEESKNGDLTFEEPMSMPEKETKIKKEKTYSEMTREEKLLYLEREKRALLEQFNNQNTNNITLQKKQ